MLDKYWREVVRAAWAKTWKPLGGSREKVANLGVVAIAAVVGGGLAGLLTLVTGYIGFIVAMPVVGVILFIYGALETQANMYRSLDDKTKHTVEMLEEKIEILQEKIEKQKRPPPDYNKWRHRQWMNLRTAAQLWSGERPSMKLIGDARETYEMLHGAVQVGTLALELDPSIDPRMQTTVRQMKQKNPNGDTIVTRAALKEFAASNGYDPEFLKD